MDTKKRDRIAIMVAVVVILAGIIYLIIDTNKEEKAEEDYDNSVEGITQNMHFCHGAEDTTSLITMQQKLQELHPDAAELDTINGYLAEIRDKYAKLQVEWKKSFDKLKTKHDDFQNATFYKNSYFTHNVFSNNVSVYFAKQGNKLIPFATISYTGPDWIFFEDITFLIDGQPFTFAFDKYKNKKTEVSGGRVAEWVDMELDYYKFISLDFREAPEVKLRLSGKYTSDRTLTSTERKALNQVFDGYRYLLSTGCTGMSPD